MAPFTVTDNGTQSVTDFYDFPFTFRPEGTTTAPLSVDHLYLGGLGSTEWSSVVSTCCGVFPMVDEYTSPFLISHWALC